MSSSPEMDRWFSEQLVVLRAEMTVAAEQMRVNYERLRAQYPILRETSRPRNGKP